MKERYYIIMCIFAKKIENMSNEITTAVKNIKTAILKSQLRAVKLVNQEQLGLYFGIGRYISANTREGKWGTGAIKKISSWLRKEMPGLRGFGETNLRNMRTFYEAWDRLDSNSSVQTDELSHIDSDNHIKSTEATGNKVDTIHQFKLMNLEGFPIVAFMSISFTHHITILTRTKDYDERLFYIKYCADFKLDNEALERIIRQDLYHHQASMPNNFLASMPDYKQAYRAIKMFKDEYLLDFINTEELGMHDEDIDERVIENNIVHNIKNFIMTFGKGFTYMGHQVHYEKFGEDNWIDLLFFNRDLRCMTVFELKKGKFKPAYLGQLSAYLRILNDDERREGENPPIGIILCKNANKPYVEYVMQDFKQPMGVATYKLSDEMESKLLQVLPPKEELIKMLETKEDIDN